MCNFARMKKTIIILYLVVVAIMAAATIIEKYLGTAFVGKNIYGAWWFSLLWALLAATGLVWIVRRRVRKWYVLTLHLALVVILLGAFLTHVTSWQGTIHLRTGQPTNLYLSSKGQTATLPFTVTLNQFSIHYHEGTLAPADYVSDLTVTDGQQQLPATVSMNNIFSHHNIRFYQSSFDEDLQGSYLAVNADPWGIPVTYLGYALLFIALLWMLVTPEGSFRQLLRNPLLRRGALSLALLAGFHLTASALHVLPRETAEQFGRLNMLYNDRICPVQTYALDFTKKLYGKPHYGDYTAEQVLTGFLFWPDEWSREPVIKVKGSELKEALQLPDYASVSTFVNEQGYLLGPYVQAYYQGSQDDLHQQAHKTDDRLMLVMELRQGTSLRLFPQTTLHGVTTWYAPADELPDDISAEHRKYIGNVISWMSRDLHEGNFAKASQGLSRLSNYQQQFGGNSIPPAAKLQAERLYNRIPFATILFMLNLTMGFLTLFFFIWQLSTDGTRRLSAIAFRLSVAIFVFSFLALTLCEALRWVVSGTIPMANGYETMLFMAWLVMLITLIGCRRFRILLTFGYLLSGFFLLVSHLGQMDPQIGHVMPVLNSPLLAVHVSVIMMSYALISLTFVCGLTALLLPSLREPLALLSRLFLSPALTTMGLGIFIGAIWANISWGTYWSWDPKETWALITFMVYAVVVHTQSLPLFSRPLPYHVYMTLAFLSLLMTYFGVNYLLGGMHSYA